GAEAIKADEDVAVRLKELNKGRLADKVIVCTGAVTAARQALSLVERGGTILFFAVPRPGDDVTLPLNDFWVNETKVMTSYYTSPVDVRNALRLIGSGRVAVADLITHRLLLEKTGEGFRLVADAGESMKVMILPHGNV
ncbi:MAG: zinc-binding dehydrogenase, partial [Candidatus Aenigmarchaeota archaeon]|nr:zinc-binding dehydrogenase [Candidatus Aenigmarchaeota archaeon]